VYAIPRAELSGKTANFSNAKARCEGASRGIHMRAILNKPISGEEIESELKKYVLLIERSRSKIPSDVKK
jgi:hypothetical protein